MLYLIDPRNVGTNWCLTLCKSVAYPMYGIPPCRSYEI